ncbi:MAG: MBL fold metallo-hydrolase [Gemmatimonadota bacterium]
MSGPPIRPRRKGPRGKIGATPTRRSHTPAAAALLVVLLVGCEAGAPAPPDPLETPGRTRLVLLGTGTPNADPERSGPALAIVVDSASYLVDAGPGVVRRAAAAASRHGLTGLTPPRLTHLFLTHLHSDHTVGVPDVMLSPWTLERTEPLTLLGPPGTAAMAGHLQQAYAEDVRVRLEGLEPANPTGWETRAHDVEPGVVFEDERVRVTAFRVPHGSWQAAYGYRFDTPDRSIVVSGDTGPADAVAQACSGCDVLVHEVYASDGFGTRPGPWQRYHSAFHTSATEVGRIAAEGGAGMLVLTHHLLWGATEASVLAEVRTHYPGPVYFGNDLDVF